MTKQSFIEQFRSARGKSVPVVIVQTADGIATSRKIAANLKATTPIINWDCIAGPAGLTEAGEQVAQDMDGIRNPIELLEQAHRMPGVDSPGQVGTVLIVQNAHEYLAANSEDRVMFTQAILNLRDPFKTNMRMLVLLGPAFNLPSQLQQHVLILDEPLPTADELTQVVETAATDAGLTLNDEQKRIATQALQGLSAFTAEQAFALAVNVSSETLELDLLWERKRKLIEDTPGLSVWNGGETFEDVCGCEQIKKYCRAILNGKMRPGAIVILDEGEQQTGGKGDTSGVSGRMMGKLLSEMQNKKYRGMIAYGVPGTGKTLIAKAMGGEAGIPVIILDLGDVQDSLVGASEARLAQALKVIDSVSNGSAFFVMTSNDLNSIPPQLKARFSTTWMYDTPNEDGIKALFDFYMKRKGLTADKKVLTSLMKQGWVGREIEAMCNLAWETDMPLNEAADMTICYAQREAANLEFIRSQASGRYLSVDEPGPYVWKGGREQTRAAVAANTSRSRQFTEDV